MLLSDDRIFELHEALVLLGLDRSALIAGIDPMLANGVHTMTNPSAQLLFDLHEFNRIEQLLDGSIPLKIYLRNAAELAGLRVERTLIEGALSAIEGHAQKRLSASFDALGTSNRSPHSSPVRHKRKPLNIVYTSDVIIRDPSLLATLAVFYDKVYLPCGYDLDPDAPTLVRWPMKHLDDLEMLQKGYTRWKERWGLLEAGALEILAPAFQGDAGEPIDLQDRILNELGIRVPFFASSDVFEGRVALAVHALFARTDAPEFFLRKPGSTDTDHLRGILATSLIQYRLPLIGELAPEQLIRMREDAEQHKDAFICYLNTLCDDVEARLAATAGDEREAAKRAIERKVLNDLNVEEHLAQQQFGSERPPVSVAVAPWNFTNYTGMAELLRTNAAASTERILQQASVRHRAFQFLSTIEKTHG